MYIADSFVPWVCTWLSTYEYWLVTGKWHYDEMFTGRNQIKEWKKEKMIAVGDFVFDTIEKANVQV